MHDIDGETERPSDRDDGVPFGDALRTWVRVALLSFGGPAGQIAVMHRILVEEKKWISEERFLHALNYCMLLPGPEAQQLATYVGWLLHRTPGGLVAGGLFILPGFLSILALSVVYAAYQQTDLVQALFFGLKPAVLAIVLEAVLRISKRVLKNGPMIALASASFVAIYFFNMPFPLLILAAALVGFVGGHLLPEQFLVAARHGALATTTHDESLAVTLVDDVRPTWKRSFKILVIGLTLWFAPLVLLRGTLGKESTYVQEGLFFSKAAVVTFGGAYSVLAYIAQQAVDRYGWLEPGEMLDGLGMAETTPGPLIQVVQFVGFMGAYRDAGPLSPMAAGILGSLLTTWVTFVPCFLWIFLGAPYVERLRGNRRLGAALSAVTAAVVGVIVNLALWFSLHTLFATVTTERRGGLRLLTPDWSSVGLAACGVAALALTLTFCFRLGMAVTLAASTAAGALLYLAVG
ncbi:MAG: chromate efflux transporter [Pirellulales bacterium]|nr:chromate efflux transporter [Pirellulales bacterium]